MDINVYLPALEQKTAVNRSKPHYSVTTLEVAQFSAAIVQKQAQALEQLGRGGLLELLANVYKLVRA